VMYVTWRGGKISWCQRQKTTHSSSSTPRVYRLFQ